MLQILNCMYLYNIIDNHDLICRMYTTNTCFCYFYTIFNIDSYLLMKLVIKNGRRNNNNNSNIPITNFSLTFIHM